MTGAMMMRVWYNCRVVMFSLCEKYERMLLDDLIVVVVDGNVLWSLAVMDEVLLNHCHRQPLARYIYPLLVALSGPALTLRYGRCAFRVQSIANDRSRHAEPRCPKQPGGLRGGREGGVDGGVNNSTSLCWQV